jgi:hypothetical protein
MRFKLHSELEKLRTTLLRPINPAIIVVLGFYTVVWGLWVISPFWNAFHTVPIYSMISAAASEYMWGSIAIACGLIITRGAMKPIYWNLDIGSMVGFLFWMTISILFFLGDWTSTGGITAAAFAAYSGLVWLNVRTNKELYGYDESFFQRHGR